MAKSYLRTVSIGILFALSLCGQAFALTVYDVIQLSGKSYSDDDIIALIQATDSAFELKAEDIPRLIDLGVSETVIQAMLKVTPEETASRSPASPSTMPPGAASTPTHVDQTPDSSIPANNSAPVFVTPGKPVAGGRFDFGPYREAGAGHHHHSVVNLAGVRLLVLRDEGSFASVAARANAIVRRLEQAALEGEGTFYPDHAAASNMVMFYGRNTNRPMIILKVSAADAIAYQRRSGRKVTPALLAGYWGDLLSDYWSVAISRTTPTRLADLHEGEALEALYEQWTTSSETKTARLADAVRLLPHQEQRHLEHLATTVPRDFRIDGSHLAEQQ